MSYYFGMGTAKTKKDKTRYLVISGSSIWIKRYISSIENWYDGENVFIKSDGPTENYEYLPCKVINER